MFDKLLLRIVMIVAVTLTMSGASALAEGSRSPSVESVHVGTGEKIDESVISLVEGATTVVHLTGSVRDPDGCGNLPSDSISATFYRSTVQGEEECSANDANCYRTLTESCHIIGCDNSRMSPVQFVCDIPVRYYAEATVLGPLKNTDWTASVIAKDRDGGAGVQQKKVEMGAVVGVNVTESINYGSANLGAVSDAQQLVVQNTGNVGLDVLLSAPDPMKCERGEIPVGSTHVGLRPDTEYSRALSIGVNALKIDLNLSPQKNELGSLRPMYLHVKIPDYGVGGRCTNAISSTAQVDDLW